MKLITVAGPPSTGKTSIIINLIKSPYWQKYNVGVIKFDCLSTEDDQRFKANGIPVKVGLAGHFCPDHYFVSNIEECLEWGKKHNLDILITESAGLCNRCSPHVKKVKAVCVIDNLMGVNTPKKIGPMLRYADIVVVTKGDIVSQAEREVFAYHIRKQNSKAYIMSVNGITGQGAFELSTLLEDAAEVETLIGGGLRFSMPASICSYGLGETKIGQDYQVGNVKKITI